MKPADYLKQLKSELETIGLEFFGESDYIKFENLRQKVAMCLKSTFGAESNEVSRVYNIVTGEKRYKATKAQKEDLLWRAIENLKTEIEASIDYIAMDTHQKRPAEASSSAASLIDTDAVFVIHGASDGAKNEVARFIEKLDLRVVILHEEANRGLTILEKFESHAIRSNFAVALLTGDDQFAPKASAAPALLRARQNVVFELGFFFGSLGRSRTAVLYERGVELPSDVHGLVYIELDKSGAWKLLLAKEFRAAGLRFNNDRLTE